MWDKVLTGVAITLVPVVGLLDMVVGHEISLSILYLIPTCGAAWFGSRRIAIVTAVFAGAMWLMTEKLTHPAFSHPFIPYWNASVRTVFFLVAVAWLSTLRTRDTMLQNEVNRQTATLREEVAQRRVLEREVAEVTAREQARIARDLHDGVGQYLAGMSFHARMLADDLQKDGSPYAEQAGRLVEQINLTNRQTRRLDSILSPPVREAGLPDALRQMIHEIEQFANVRCSLEVPTGPVALDTFQALNLFRITQEALNNAIKHGDAKSIVVELTHVPTGLRLRVSDRGRGLSQESTGGAGAGLRIMRHRAELIGAALDIRTGDGFGCVVECHLPIFDGMPRPQGQ